MTVEAVQGNQVPLKWTESFWGFLEWWHDPWSSSPLSCGERLLLKCDENARNSFPTNSERNPYLEVGGGNEAPLDFGMTLSVPLEWRRVCRELLELHQGPEGPFGS